MAQVDHLKERIGYLKLWLGIIIAVDVSVFGWLVANARGSDHDLLAVVLGVLLVAVLSAMAVFLHSKIDGWIVRLDQ